MKKDVIYIDIEDDITAIIGKVKAAEAKIVALVPPKRVGVLQSAVNLKLLQRAAATADKRAVLITNDHSLIALAAGLKMPVAKNLQSAPEIPQVPALQVDDEEIINGAELPVGELAAARETKKPSPSAPAARKPDSIEEITPEVDTPMAPAPVAAAAAKDKTGNKFKIPNFDSFRKKFFLFGGIGAALLLFLIWALVFAPKATVTINAKTTAVNIDRILTMDPDLDKSDPKKLDLKPSVETLKKSVAVEFTATGSKNIGDKASGEITLSNGESDEPITVSSGTTFTSASGKKFTNDSPVTVPGAGVEGGGIVPGTATITVKASAIGSEYNIDPQGYSVQGYSGLDATGDKMDGGSKQKVTVVSQADVNKATDSLVEEDSEEAKADLQEQFTGDVIIIQESFTTQKGTPTVTPNIGEEASQAKVTLETTYTLVGLSRDDVKGVLQSAIDDALKGKDDQQLYSLGDDNVVFQAFEKEGGKYKAQLIATGYIGAKIDTVQLAKDLAGKRFGEIESKVNQIPGVNNVTVDFSPFWVTTAPAPDKIDIRFSVANDTGN